MLISIKYGFVVKVSSNCLEVVFVTVNVTYICGPPSEEEDATAGNPKSKIIPPMLTWRKSLYKSAVKAVEKAANKGVIKANTASRKKSRLDRALNSMK